MKTIQTEIQAFLNHCKFEKNLSPKTIKAYTTDLEQLTRFLLTNEHSFEVISISKTEIRGFLESLSSFKPKTIKRKVATLKAIFNYLEFEDKIVINPVRKMRIKIKEAKVLPKVISTVDIHSLFRVAHKSSTILPQKRDNYDAIRNLLVIELLFATGARVSEIASLKIDNVNVNSGEIILRGKGNKERCIQICNKEVLSLLKIYTATFKFKIDRSGGYLLTNRFGNGLSDQSIRTIVKSLRIQAGINKLITPHMFRHTVATLLLENDVDIKYIQSILGHSSINTTQIYTHVNSIKQRQILESKHPRKDIFLNIL